MLPQRRPRSLWPRSGWWPARAVPHKNLVAIGGDRSAATLSLPGRGVLREGGYADIVVFDPATVADRATFGDPHQLSAGMSEVLVNGKVTISAGAFTGELAGRALAGPGARR